MLVSSLVGRLRKTSIKMHPFEKVLVSSFAHVSLWSVSDGLLPSYIIPQRNRIMIAHYVFTMFYITGILTRSEVASLSDTAMYITLLTHLILLMTFCIGMALYPIILYYYGYHGWFSTRFVGWVRWFLEKNRDVVPRVPGESVINW